MSQVDVDASDIVVGDTTFTVQRAWLVNGIIIPTMCVDGVTYFVLRKSWWSNYAWTKAVVGETRPTAFKSAKVQLVTEVLDQLVSQRGRPTRHGRRVSVSGTTVGGAAVEVELHRGDTTAKFNCLNELSCAHVVATHDSLASLVQIMYADAQCILGAMLATDAAVSNTPTKDSLTDVDSQPAGCTGDVDAPNTEIITDDATSNAIDKENLPFGILWAPSRTGFVVKTADRTRMSFTVRAHVGDTIAEIEHQRSRAIHFHSTGLVKEQTGKRRRSRSSLDRPRSDSEE